MSTVKEQEETQGQLKGPCYWVALPNAAGALQVGRCRCATPVPPCTPHLPPTRTLDRHIHVLPALHNMVTAAAFWPWPTRWGSGKWSDRVWDTLICPSFSAIGKEMLQTALSEKEATISLPNKARKHEKVIFQRSQNVTICPLQVTRKDTTDTLQKKMVGMVTSEKHFYTSMSTTVTSF